MFCRKCGQQIDDTSKVCSYCGEMVEANQDNVDNGVNEMEASMMGTAPSLSPQKKNNIMLGIIAAVAGVVGILVIILVFSIFGKSEKTPLDNVEKILNKQPTNIDKIVKDTSPKFVSKAYLDVIAILKGNDEYKDDIEDLYEEGEKALEDAWDELNDSAEDELGKNVKFSYKIEDKEKIDKDDLETVAELYQELGQFKDELTEAIEIIAEATELEDKEVKKLVKVVEILSDEFENFKITKGYELEVEVTAKGKDDDKDKTVNLVVVKANGEWMIDPLLTAALANDMDIDDIKDMYDENIKDSLDEYKDNIDDMLEMLEESVKELDDDVIKMILDEALSNIE